MTDTATRPGAPDDAAPQPPKRQPPAPRDGTANLDRAYQGVLDLGLAEHALELDAKGYTIVPPEKVGPPGYADELLAAAVRIAERESGITPDFETGLTHSGIPEERRKAGKSLFPFQEEHGNVIFKERAFEDFLLNPTIMALVTYLIGEQAILSNNGVWFRGPMPGVPAGIVPPTLHSDNYSIPQPFPAYAQMCNATIALTDYTRDGGCLGFVPGSHHLMRHPHTTAELLDKWVPAEAPAGSLIFWHGNTWHTIGNPRVVPGLRVSLVMLFIRSYLLPINLYKDWVTDEMLDRNPERFAVLMGKKLRFGNNHDPFERGTNHAEAIEGGIGPAPSIWE